MRVGVIAGVSPERVIGKDNTIPWRRPADLKRFKRLTTGGTVVMGRLTWESLGRPLPKRRNVVITQTPEIEGTECFRSLEGALATCAGEVWIIGGARLFQAALEGPADFVDLTFVPDHVDPEGAVLFPRLDARRWAAGPLEQNAEDPALWHRRYRRL